MRRSTGGIGALVACVTTVALLAPVGAARADAPSGRAGVPAVVGPVAPTAGPVSPFAMVAAVSTSVTAGGTAVAEEGDAATTEQPRIPVDDAQVEQALGAAQDAVSFSVRDRRTGATYTYNPELENRTGSIVKVLVLATLMRERRDGGDDLTGSQRELAERMIRVSDNDATTTLWNQAGGAPAMERLVRDLGLEHTTVSTSWGKTTTTAEDQRVLMDRLVDGTPVLESEDRAYVLDLMSRVDEEQSWGVGDVPGAAAVQLKNGWVPIEPRGWRVNSIGGVQGAGRDYTLAVITYDNASMDEGVERAGVVSEMVWRALAPAQESGGADDGRPGWALGGGALPPRPLR